MKLFLISQEQNSGYFTYDSAVVAAPDEETARQMDPSEVQPMMIWGNSYNYWCSGPEHVVVRHIGEAAADVAQGVICSSIIA